MRLKHIKNAEEIISKSEYIVNNPIDYFGKWNSLFKNNNKIEIEIGTGRGKFIINKAILNPNINYIGIEKYDSPLVNAVKILNNKNLNNLKLVCFDAYNINELFNHEIDKIYLNFSDPWPKNRHALRRLTSPVFLEKYDSIFKSNARIIQKTDNRKLFEYSIMSFVEHGYKIDKISLDLYHDDLEGNIPTEYEQRFASLGQIIYMIEVFNVNLHVKSKKTIGK